MADVEKYGSPCCATCGDRGILTDREGRPSRCVPCSSARREVAEKQFGYHLVCNGCTAILRVADHGGRQRRPRAWAMFGPLCGPCLAETPLTESERKSA